MQYAQYGFPSLVEGARLRIQDAGVRPDEKLVILSSQANYRPLVEAFVTAAVSLGLDPVHVEYKARPQLSGLPRSVLDAACEADVVIDLNFIARAYSDSHQELVQRLRARGGRFGPIMTWCLEEDVINFINCPPDARVKERTQRARVLIDGGTSFRVTSELGTHLEFERGDPEARPAYLLDGQVAIAPPEESLNGHLVFVGGYRIQAPLLQKRMVYEPVALDIENGHIVSIDASTEVGTFLRQWFAEQRDPIAYRFAHVNLGLDHRIRLEPLDNAAVHFNYGALLLGFGTNYSPNFGSTARGSSHIDMNYVRPTLEIDGQAVLRDGVFSEASGLA